MIGFRVTQGQAFVDAGISLRIKERAAISGYKPFGAGIRKDFRPACVFSQIISEFPGMPLSHQKVVHEVGTAVYR